MKLEINNKGDADVTVMTDPESDGTIIKVGERITVETDRFCMEVCEIFPNPEFEEADAVDPTPNPVDPAHRPV